MSFTTPDTDGSESWAATTRIEGVPTGARIANGQEISAGIWEVSTEALRTGSIRYHAAPNSDADAQLTLRTTLQDSANGVTNTREHTGSMTVTVLAVADAPVVTARNATVLEDQVIPLDLAARLTDLDGSESLLLRLEGVPSDGLLSQGRREADGSWTLATADLPGLTLTMPQDYAGRMALTLQVTAQDHDNSSNVSRHDFTVTVDAVADAPGLRVAAALGVEDRAIALSIAGWTTDIDGSESLLGFRVLDLPAGVVAQAGGRVLERGADGVLWVPAADASSLTVTPPADSDVDFTLRIIAVSGEPNGSTAESAVHRLPVYVGAVADTPIWSRVSTTGSEDAPIALNLGAGLSDTDGSERLFYVIRGVPTGTVMNVGTFTGPGTWSLTAEEAAMATLSPPKDFAGELKLSVTAISQEQSGGSQALSTREVTLFVGGVIDTVDDSASAQGFEDQPILLALAPRLVDRDGSEQLVGMVQITGVPADAVLRSAKGSVLQPKGDVYFVAADSLDGVSLTLGPDSDATVLLTVRAVVEEQGGGARAEVTRELRVDALGVADAPELRTGAESLRAGAPAGEWTKLPLAASLQDLDGSESLQIWLLDVPEGVVLSAGTPGGGGMWLLQAKELDGLSIRAPGATPGEVTLRVMAVAQEREGDAAITEAKLSLWIMPPTDGGAPGDGAPGGKDPSQPPPPPPPPASPSLAVTLGAAVEDGQAALTIKVTPPGPGESLGILLEDLPPGARPSAGTLQPMTGAWLLTPAELDGLTLQLPPDLAGSMTLRVSAVVKNGQGRSVTTVEKAELEIEAVADGAKLGFSPGAALEDGSIALNLSARALDIDGSEVLGSVIISDLTPGAQVMAGPGIIETQPGIWVVDAAQLNEVRLLPPPDLHGTVNFTVDISTREVTTGVTAHASHKLSVEVAAVADAPLLRVRSSSGLEDTSIPLNIAAGLTDTDGSEVLSLVLRGLPRGALLTAGTNNGDGSWTLTPDDIPGLAVRPPWNWSGQMDLTLEAYALERSTGLAASSASNFQVLVGSEADRPIGDVVATAKGAEDTTIALEARVWLTDDDRSEDICLVIRGVPEGGSFSAGASLGNGVWEVPGAEIPGLRFTPPANVSGRFDMVVEATSREATGGEASTSFPWSVTVTAVADAPVLTLADALGREDTTVALNIAAAVTDTDGSEAVARYLVNGVPPGAALSAGQDLGGGSWRLAPADVVGLQLRPPADFAGSIRLTVTAVARENANGDEAMSTNTLDVTLRPVADAPVLTLADALGREDTAVALNIAAAVTDTDGSEAVARYLVNGVPPGAALSAGQDLGGGSWRLAPADVVGLQLRPPADFAGSIRLTVTAVARENANGDEAMSTNTLDVTLRPVADAPVLTLADALGREDQALPLDLQLALSDTDGSETLSALRLEGLPAGFALSSGTALGGGVWALLPSALPGLQLSAPKDWNGSLDLSLAATSSEQAGGSATTSRAFRVTFTAENDAPALSVTAARDGVTGEARLALLADAAVQDVDSTQMGGASITLTGAAAGEGLAFAGYTPRIIAGRIMLGDTGVEMQRAGDGGVTLLGAAPTSTYVALLESLTLETDSANGLTTGPREIGLTLLDSEGLPAARQVVALTVSPSEFIGDGSSQMLIGTPNRDRFEGSAGNETMLGGDGADLFVLHADGSSDQVEGGGGSWMDRIDVQGAGAPGQGWTVTLADGSTPAPAGQTMDFTEPAAGTIQFADGGQVEFSGIERISW